MKYYKVPENVWIPLMQYLEKRPFFEVAQALIEISKLNLQPSEDREAE